MAKSDEQNQAWIEQVHILQESAVGLLGRQPRSSNWQLILEYAIPRRRTEGSMQSYSQRVPFWLRNLKWVRIDSTLLLDGRHVIMLSIFEIFTLRAAVVLFSGPSRHLLRQIRRILTQNVFLESWTCMRDTQRAG